MARPGRPRLPDEFDSGFIPQRAQLGAMRLDGRSECAAADRAGIVGHVVSAPITTQRQFPIRDEIMPAFRPRGSSIWSHQLAQDCKSTQMRSNASTLPFEEQTCDKAETVAKRQLTPPGIQRLRAIYSHQFHGLPAATAIEPRFGAES